MKIFEATMTMMMLMTIILILTIKMSKKFMYSREKNTSFECGFSSMNSARKSFSIQFFMIAMMFLIFDMEISIILPMMSTKMINMKEWMNFTTMMIMILTMGLFQEWNNGMLEWTK